MRFRSKVFRYLFGDKGRQIECFSTYLIPKRYVCVYTTCLTKILDILTFTVCYQTTCLSIRLAECPRMLSNQVVLEKTFSACRVGLAKCSHILSDGEFHCWTHLEHSQCPWSTWPKRFSHYHCSIHMENKDSCLYVLILFPFLKTRQVDIM